MAVTWRKAKPRTPCFVLEMIYCFLSGKKAGGWRGATHSIQSSDVAKASREPHVFVLFAV